MAANAWQAEPANADALWAALIRRAPYVLDTGEDTQTIDLQTALAVWRGGSWYAYDPTDSTTAHDGVAVLVDQNGRRYKLSDDLKRPLSVLDRTGTPPGSPSTGDAYLVTAGATGAWAGQDDDVAVYTATGWRFIAPQPGMVLYVEDETAFYHHSAGGAWVAGLGTLVLSADAVTPVEALFWGGLAVESVTNTEPGAPTDGQAWLVGTSPSGAFTAQNDKIAFRRGGAWTYLDPYEGAKVWDKVNDYILTYNGTWEVPAEIQPVESEIIDLAGITSYDILDLGDYVKVELMAQFTGGPASLSVRTSTDNGGSFAIASSDYLNWSSGTTTTGMTLGSYTAGSERMSIGALEGLNKATIRTALSNPNGTAYRRVTAELNNAIRIFGASAITSGKLLVKKYRG